MTEAAGAGHTDIYTVALNTLPSASVAITVESGDTAAATVSPATLTFATTNWATAQTVTVTGVDDNMDQGNRSVAITHTAASGDTNYNGINIATVTAMVVDDAPPPPAIMPTVTIVGGLPSPLREGAAAVFTVSRSGPVTVPLMVLLRVSEATGGGQDFVASGQEGAKTVAIPSGAASAPYTVPTVNDNTDEPNGMVTVTLNSSSAYVVGIPSAAAVNVNDDDVNGGGGPPGPMPPAATPVVSITGGGGVTEGQAATFTVTAVPAPPPGEPISVNVAISDSGDFAATGQSGSRSVTIDASGMARFTVSTQDDAIHEDYGRITATVQEGRGYSPHGNNSSASLTVADNKVVMLSVSHLRVAEGGNASYDIALDTRPSGDVTVAITAPQGSELTLAPHHRLTFTPTHWNEEQSLTVTAPENFHALDRPFTLNHTATGAIDPNLGLTTQLTVTVVAAHPTEETKAWQLRLGRTVSHQVMDALEDHLSAPPGVGLPHCCRGGHRQRPTVGGT